MKVTFKVEQNKIFGDFRVDKYLDGVWVNQRDNNWNKSQADKKAKKYRDASKNGVFTMTDNY